MPSDVSSDLPNVVPSDVISEPAQRPPVGVTTPGYIHRVIDGDTLVFMVRGTFPVRVRLLDCWAPESRTLDPHEKELGLAAKQALAEFEGQHGVLFIPTGQAAEVADLLTLGRVLGGVWVHDDQQSLSAMMRKAGLCWATKPAQKQAVEDLRPCA